MEAHHVKRSPSPDNTTVAPDHSAVQRAHWASPGCPYESGTSEPAPHQRPAPEVPARCVGGTSHDGHERISRASSVSNLVHSRIPCQHLGDRSAHPTETPGLLFSRELRSVHGRCVGKKTHNPPAPPAAPCEGHSAQERLLWALQSPTGLACGLDRQRA